MHGGQGASPRINVNCGAKKDLGEKTLDPFPFFMILDKSHHLFKLLFQLQNCDDNNNINNDYFTG